MSTEQGSAKTYHFISGLPRSGSTLLSAILRQNPRFHAGMTSPLSGLFNAIVSSVSAGSELSTLVSREQRKRLLKGLFDSYYADLPADRAVVFDTNRAWTGNLAALAELFPGYKERACPRTLGRSRPGPLLRHPPPFVRETACPRLALSIRGQGRRYAPRVNTTAEP